MWRKLNKEMAKHGVIFPWFKGFMANSAQTNWNVVHIAYTFGDPYVPLQDNEQTCSFHWNQSMDKHKNNKSSQI
jgi:hypothetical protein